MNRIFPVLAGLIFLLAGLALIPWPGLHHDELFFTGPMYPPAAVFFGSATVPIMVTSYTGALKTWIYEGLFQFFVPGVWSVRVPVLLMGVAAIWLTWAWVRRIAGNRAAAIAAILLGTDATFLLTDVFDWGPVALQHLLLLAGLVAIQRWLDCNSNRALGLGLFFWGLGMWDKALFAWPLAGLAVASFCMFRRELFTRIRPVPALIAIGAFLLGAAPLIWYNVARPGETASANAAFTASALNEKVRGVEIAIDGSMLFSYMLYPPSTPHHRQPQGLLARASVKISNLLHHPAHSLMFFALIAAALLSFAVPAPTRRLLAFLAITTAVAWVMMLFNKGTGASAHHLVLLWPFPIVFIAIVLASLNLRVTVAAVALFAASNLLVENEYLARFIYNGGQGPWTDAIFRLSDTFDARRSGWIGVLDWGAMNPLRMLHEGDLRLFEVALDDPAELAREAATPGAVFIHHTDTQQIFPDINQRFRDAVARLGYAEEIQGTIPDDEGRPVFEIVRLRKP